MSERELNKEKVKETPAAQITKPEVNVLVETADPVRRITKYVLAITALIFIWYIIADRHAPWSDQARVQTYVIPIVPQVSGRVTEVLVKQDQIVSPGDVLFKIDPSDYQLAVEDAEAALELAGQEIGAGMATVVTAQAQLVVAETNVEHVRAQSARVFEMEEKNVLSHSDGDKARAAIKASKAEVISAKANLDKAKQSLGKAGNANPRIRSALAKLKKAQLDLSRTVVLAPSLGGITNLQIDIGFYAKAGAAAMTFIEGNTAWIQVNLRENNLANLAIGNSVEIALDVDPGTIYRGKISSIGFAVDTASTSAVGSLANVESKSGWLRDAQRFPVMITFDDDSTKGKRRLGGQADVQIYTGDNWFVNSLGWAWIRVLSILSYVY
ncbi:HlyD family secretion protein [Colwellia psychrerythraea]|uniref:Secretion protein HlyD family protein n=1 Tax=Colwellia psychrerythraea TaxID=28229 RepID=A0A099KFJ3_COLPS|nr:HlyD family secretion protein [Colwellia psychrerythraea]KGJ89050.1 secretion protein HlyD family protein [Colwellia psychrerythraea]